MIVIGIDPGLTGGISMLGHRGQYHHCVDMPVMQRMSKSASVKNQVNGGALTELLRDWMQPHDKNEVVIVIETPIAFPGQNASTTASAFLTSGIIEGVVMARGYTHYLVSPSEWKKALKLSKDKEICRAAAIRLFPEASLARKKDHNRAESLLIAHYGFNKYA